MVVSANRTYVDTTKFGKKVSDIGDSHLNRMKKNIFQSSVNGGDTIYNVF